MPDRGALIGYPAQRVVREDGAYRWHRADVSEAHARRAIATGRLQLTAPSGEHLDFAYERHVEHANGDWTWVGSVHGDPSQEAIITFGEKAAFGTIGQSGKEPLRLTIRNGTSWLVETDPRKIAGINNAGTRPTKPDFIVAPDVAGAAVQRKRGSSDAAIAGGSAPGTAAAGPAAASTVDLVLGYTPGFVSYYQGESQAGTRLNNMVAITNEAYRNSQVDAQVRLVRTVLVNYTDADANDVALQEVTAVEKVTCSSGSGTCYRAKTPSPVFNELRAAREQYGADLVSLVRRFNTPENDGCGIAWLLGGGRTTIDSSDAYFGYSVVSDGQDAGTDGKTYFCRDETLAHELGHNMGSAHDRDTADGDDNVLQNDEYGVYAYSFGYKTANTAGNFYTIMAYGDTGQTRYRVFSNPRINSCGGQACGVPEEADNARSLNNTMSAVASFRASVVPAEPTPPPPGRLVPRDVNADGRSDLLWLNPDTGEVHNYLLNGASIVGSIGGYAVPVGFRAGATGDYNADGYSDVLFENGFDVRLALGGVGGRFAAAQSVLAFPLRWELQRSGDFNADGRSDMLWFNPETGEVHYYLMSGLSLVGQRGGFHLPKGYRIRAVADTNGDARSDLVVSNGNDVRVALMDAAGGFVAPTVVLAYPAGWTLTGSADLDADGRSDLVWQHPDLGEVHVHCLNGAVITCSRGGYYLPKGYLVRQFGDYNADGRADILSSNGLEMRISLAATTSFIASATLNNYAAGWLIVEDHIRRPVGIGDVDRDNRSDLVWFNTSTGEVHYHVMNGPQIIGGRGGYFTPAGLVPKAIGDFDGDGRSDVLMAGGGQARLLMAQTTGAWVLSATSFTYPVGWAIAGTGDVDGDGKTDVVMHNASTGEVHVFYMVGANAVGGRGGYSMPPGYTIRGVADFSGDGLADLLWANASEVHVSLARADAAFAPSVKVLNTAAGWTLAGAADMDGDRRADILWHNASSGELFYYFMNGAAAFGGQSYAMTVGYTLKSVGDFNADGRTDLVWSNGGRLAISMGSTAGGLAASTDVMAYPAGWHLVDARGLLN